MKLKRNSRYATPPHDTTKFVRFYDFQDIQRTCPVKEFSKTGLSFILEDGSLLFKIGDCIKNMRLYSMDKEVHATSATILHIQDEDKAGTIVSRIGCTFKDNILDVESIIEMDKVSRLRNEFMDFIQSMAVEENLDPEFVHLASHLRSIFTKFKERLSHEEQIILKEDEKLQPVLLEALRDLSFEALRDTVCRYYNRFSKIIDKFADPKMHFIHHAFFQKQLSEFIWQSRMLHRAYYKPLGYAGDYEMMNIIYRNQFEGNDIFSQVMNKIDCEGVAANAVRNRRFYLYEKLNNLMKSSNPQVTKKVMSVACGPTVELYDLLSSQGDGKPHGRMEFIAMDQSAQAIENARSNIEHLIENRSDIVVHFAQDNIKRLIAGAGNRNDLYTNLDLVYSAGLFDYLSDRAAVRLIRKLYNFLKPGGVLIIGNFGPYNPQQFIMEYGSEWFLVYRSEQDLMELGKSIPENALISVEKEPEGVNLFLNIQKPA